MYESTGSYPDGLFDSLNVHAVGLFDECLNIRPPEPLNFTGKYCTVFLNSDPLDYPISHKTAPSFPFKPKKDLRTGILAFPQYLHFLLGSTEVVPERVADAYPSVWGEPSIGICLPSSCSYNDLRASVAQMVGTFVVDIGGLKESIVTITDDNFCFSDSDPAPEFDGADIAVMYGHTPTCIYHSINIYDHSESS